MARAQYFEHRLGRIRLISLEDVLARTARLLLDLRIGVQVPSKHANDFSRLANLLPSFEVEIAWQDHRKPDDPLTFHEASTVVQNLLVTRHHLLVAPQYSKDVSQLCPRCIPSPAFPLADPQMVLSLLGYC